MSHTHTQGRAMLSSVFGKSFNAGKCKTLLRLAISRIKLLRNKRDMQLKQMRRELGQLLQAKQELTARIRVEHVFREQNIMAAYEIMELFSELLVVRLPIIESQRQCPIDLREAIASLIFAAPRCADLPELQQISSLFAVKYGKDFAAAAAELRPDCGVNRLVIEKLSVKAPSGEARLKLMKEIAEEQGVDWDAAASEAEFHKCPADLLDGPDRFMGGVSMHFQEPIKEPNSSIASDFRSHSEAREDDTQSIPFTLPDPPSACQSQPASNKSPSTEQNAQGLDAYELAREEDYKDAADAARAAALSAERAAAAAIAVASLAKENFARMRSGMSKRSTIESSSASDEDDYGKDRTMQRRPPSAPTNEYFKIQMDSFDAHLNTTKPELPIQMDSFDAHLNTTKPELPDGRSTTAKPLFDEYPEEEVRYARAHIGKTRKSAVVEDYTSDEGQSDSTDGSDSPPLYRRGKFEDNHANSRNMKESPRFDSYDDNTYRRSRAPLLVDPHENDGYERQPSKSRGLSVHPHENWRHYDGYERQPSNSRGLSVQKGGYSGPPQRRPPNRPHDVQTTPNTAPHVHPKLPNYDDLAARFEALRSRS